MVGDVLVGRENREERGLHVGDGLHQRRGLRAAGAVRLRAEAEPAEEEGLPVVTLGQVALVYRGGERDVAVGIQRKGLHVVAVVRAEVAVKAHIVGQRGATVAQVPLAHHAGGVTCGLQHLRQCNLLGWQAHMAVVIKQRMKDIVPDAAGGKYQVG